jgi:hypothetical protein
VEVQKGGGCLSLFGLPFFLAGVFLVLGAAGVVPIGNASERTRLVLGQISPVFLGVGAALVFGRHWLVLDTGSGSLIRRYGLRY